MQTGELYQRDDDARGYRADAALQGLYWRPSTRPLLEHYERLGLLKQIDGIGPAGRRSSTANF